MTTSTQSTTQTPVRGRWKRRLLVVAGAAVAAVVVFLVETLAGTVHTPAMNGQQSQALNAGFVFFVAAFGSLVGWGLLALLEKFTAKAHTIWRVVAAVAFVLSLGGPMSGTGITGGNRLELALLHLTVAAVLIPLLPGSRSRTA